MDTDTARLRHADQEERQRRAEVRALARKNLAALCCDARGVDVARDKPFTGRVLDAAEDFAVLAAYLGLDEAVDR